MLVRMGASKGFRAVCLREVQNSLKDSVKQLLEDWLNRLHAGPEFTVMRDEIRHRNGGLIIFRGMNDQSADTIKSLEGFDVAWFEEAQTATQRSLDLLRPTIRKPGSELWFTWNPRYKTDPIDIFLRQNMPEDHAVIVRANWSDNPYFPDVLNVERLLDKLGDPARYAHIWEGAYEDVGDKQFIPAGIVEKARKASVETHAFDELVFGVDVARFGGDETVIAIRRGRDAKSIQWITLRQLDTMQVAARVAELMDYHRPDAVMVDAGGLGAGVVDRLNQLGRRIIPVDFGGSVTGLTKVKTANKRAEMWQRMKEWLAQGGVSIPDDDKLEAQLTSVEYSHDTNNAILLEKKHSERRVKLGLPSPDRADALALTFAFPVVKAGFDDDYAEDDYGRNGTTGY